MALPASLMRGYERSFFPYRDTSTKAPKHKIVANHPSKWHYDGFAGLANKGVRAHFFPYGDTSTKAPKHKNVAISPF